MKNIGVYLRTEPHQGGAYQFWISVIDALASAKEQHNFNIVLFAEKTEWKALADKYDLKFEILSQDKVTNKMCNILFSIVFPFPVYRRICPVWSGHYGIILKNKIDIWIASSPKRVTKDLHIKSISPIFDLMHLYESSFKEVQVNKKGRERTNKKICKYASIVLADSQVGKNQIVESYGNRIKNLSKKVKVLPFIPADYIYNACDVQQCMDVGFDKYILYPAQFWAHKNHKNLLLAISLLKRKGIIINLVCVGSAKNAFENVKKIIPDEDLDKQVKILGYVSNDDIISLYKYARAMVMPTFFGPTNIPPLEAFVLGCPVAISNIYGIPEQVGEAALLFDPDSVEEIAECVERLWVDDVLCEKLITEGKKRSELWGQRQYADMLAQYIDELE